MWSCKDYKNSSWNDILSSCAIFDSANCLYQGCDFNTRLLRIQEEMTFWHSSFVTFHWTLIGNIGNRAALFSSLLNSKCRFHRTLKVAHWQHSYRICYIVLLLTTRCSHSTTRCLHIGTRYFYSIFTTRWLQRFILPSHLMMKFCRGRFIWVFPIQHIFFYKCGQYFLHLLVKGYGLLSSNAILGSLSVLSWYTIFHF